LSAVQKQHEHDWSALELMKLIVAQVTIDAVVMSYAEKAQFAIEQVVI
jgi:hypothetical protein